MQTKYFQVAIISVILTSLLVGISLAQPPEKRGPLAERGERLLERIPDLTDGQKEQINDLKTQHMKEVLPLRNLVQEKQAQLKSISTGDKVDMDKVNNTIEEIGKIKIDLAKKRAAHRQEIRNVLTEDQRVIFDSMPMKRGRFAGNDCRPQRHKRDMRPGNRF
jgi:Spy/CpxP family protein refolding chaperone